MLNSISESIKRRRKELKLSQTYVADIAGINLNTISRIERGEANPTVEVLEKIADVLGLVLKLEVKGLNTNESR
ncbi:transcriptional regulator with XRE-family HTH domain [Pedobacter africanus]|uniref:Transcriptional regulator with XRE-family HTH domain n=1 Tax=Pedobacter africanus TaxID=151894 RepID=A0ACC6KU30_9SPHI|nr:helix-turn-helix transcriptional regulator [Pedobacter africanus]MDR6782736.1 transcriptional regulator with XRE-family HTH domain [Pedobacter africanus]